MMKSLLTSLVLIFSSFLYSQNYYVKQLGIEQGLSNNSVVNITQDKDGFLWFATEEGLNKFDGNRFINTRTILVVMNLTVSMPILQNRLSG